MRERVEGTNNELVGFDGILRRSRGGRGRGRRRKRLKVELGEARNRRDHFQRRKSRGPKSSVVEKEREVVVVVMGQWDGVRSSVQKL